jgi:hypothetical protein
VWCVSCCGCGCSTGRTAGRQRQSTTAHGYNPLERMVLCSTQFIRTDFPQQEPLTQPSNGCLWCRAVHRSRRHSTHRIQYGQVQKHTTACCVRGRASVVPCLGFSLSLMDLMVENAPCVFSQVCSGYICSRRQYSVAVDRVQPPLISSLAEPVLIVPHYSVILSTLLAVISTFSPRLGQIPVNDTGGVFFSFTTALWPLRCVCNPARPRSMSTLLNPDFATEDGY